MDLQDDMEQQGAAQAGSAARAAVGAMLREAREGMGMSVEEVAGRLKFAPRQVAALEAGDFSQLPEMTFIRGFVRSYARLLQLDEKTLLDALPGAPAPAAIQVRTAVDVVPRQGAERMRQNLFWLGAALVVVVLGIIAWKYDAGETKSAPTGSAAEVTQAGASSQTADVNQVPGTAQPAAPGQAAGAAPSAGAIGSAGTAESSGMPPAGAAQPQGAGAEPPPAAAPGAARAPETTHAGEQGAPEAGQHGATIATPRVSAVPASAPAAHLKRKLSAASSVAATGESVPHAQGPSRGVHFEFSEDSWVEVRDGNGRLLLSTLGKQGGTLNASGPPPLSVVIGNAKGVKLTYKGQPVTLEPMAGSEVARLKLE